MTDQLRAPPPPRTIKTPHGELPIITFIEAVELVESTIANRLDALDCIAKLAADLHHAAVPVCLLGIPALMCFEFAHAHGTIKFAIEILPTKEKP